MSKSKSIRIDPELFDALNEIREDKGIPIAEQIRRGMWEWVRENEAVEVQRIKNAHAPNLGQ